MQKPLFSKDISLSLFTETEAYRREKYPPLNQKIKIKI